MAWGDPVFDPSQASIPAQTVRNVNFTRSASSELEQQPIDGLKIYHAIPPLPDTREELQEIAKTLNANPLTDLFLGQAATKQSVIKANQQGELAKRKVIVFATHGLMAGDLPHLTQPAIALAADGTEVKDVTSPLLLLEDVLSLKLNADWVVLSACNTAADDGRAQEALSGLARGFFYAGGRSLLITHWAVESESAKEISTQTLQYFSQNPNAPKSASLRAAMLQVMSNSNYKHPAFWAPYVLVGDSQR
jgi:CHAT domain-containing protein